MFFVKSYAGQTRAVRRGGRTLALLATMLLLGSWSFFSGAQTAPAASFWSGESSGYAITWNASDLVARKGAVVVFSARAFAKAGLAHYIEVGKDPDTGKMPNCSYERRFRLLAVVGPRISFSDQYYASCPKEAHPSGETRFVTLDLNRPGTVAYAGSDEFGNFAPDHLGKVLQLTDLFSDRDIYSALVGADVIRRVLDDTKSKPTDLQSLLTIIAGQSGRQPNCFLVPDNLLTHFALRRIGSDGIGVQIGIPGDGPCRDELTPVPLLFALSAPRSGVALAQADVKFTQEGEWDAASRQTVIRLRTGTPRH